jgi:hypothetical protein
MCQIPIMNLGANCTEFNKILEILTLSPYIGAMYVNDEVTSASFGRRYYLRIYTTCFPRVA